jgi:glycosyltransferase involved in cell wall biosynthesis
MTIRPSVSVIIPAYNAAAYVGDTVRSALMQTFVDLEVIVIDDGSTDHTAQVVSTLMVGDTRLHLRHQQNAGVAAARNTGVMAARGRFIAILDADDLWHPTKIERQMAVMNQAGKSFGMVYCRYREIDQDGLVLRSPIFEPYSGDVYGPLVLFNFIGGGSAALIRRECLDEVGGFDTGLLDRGRQGAEDIKLFLAIAERYDVGFADAFLLGYRQMGGTMSTDCDSMVRFTDVVLKDAQARHPELPARLFRWARGECRAWLATEALYASRWRPGLRLLGQALRLDPSAVARQRTVHALYIALSRLVRSHKRSAVSAMKGRSDASADAAVDSVGVAGRPFLEVAPEHGLEAPSTINIAIARRCAQAALWRTVRPATESMV